MLFPKGTSHNKPSIHFEAYWGYYLLNKEEDHVLAQKPITPQGGWGGGWGSGLGHTITDRHTLTILVALPRLTQKVHEKYSSLILHQARSRWTSASGHLDSRSQPQCCVRLGFRGSPSSEPLLLVAPRSEAVSARPDCCSGVRLKRMLQTFIQTCLKLSSSRQMQGSRGCSFYVAVQGARCSSAKVASSGTQCLAWKLDCMCGKSQLFHMTSPHLSKLVGHR